MKSADGKIRKIHVLRLEPGEDVLGCITEYCKVNGIVNGAVMTGIGSLDGCTFFDPMELEGKPGCYGYVTPIDLPTPIELVGLNGVICHDPSGESCEPIPHIHASFADENGNEYGGHLKDGNLVLVTVEIVLAEFEGVDMVRKLDPEKGVPVMSPEKPVDC